MGENLKKFIPLFIIAVSFLLVFSFQFFYPFLFMLLNDRGYDSFFRLSHQLQGPPEVSPYISILAVDDSFVEEYGMDWYSRFIKALDDVGAEVIAYDYIFTGEKEDDSLASAVNESGNIYLPLYMKNVASHPSLNSRLRGLNPKIIKNISPPLMNHIITSSEKIISGARGTGHVNLNTTENGGRHSIYSYFQYNSSNVPAFAISVVCGFLGVDPGGLKIYGDHYIEIMEARFPGGLKKDIRIPIDRHGKMIINWTGPWQKSFSYIDPRWLVGDRTVNEERAFNILTADSVVLIIDATTRGKDFTSTPFNSFAPAGIIPAHIINSILKNDFLKSLTIPGELIFYIFIFLALFITTLKPGSRGFLLLRWGLLILLLLWNLFAFMVLKIIFPPVIPVLCLILSLIGLGIYEFFRDFKNTALGIMDKLEENPSETMTMLFNRRCEQYKITARQKEIIFLTYKSLETKEIAYKLKLATRTVSNHLANIYQKCGARNKMALVKIFFTE